MECFFSFTLVYPIVILTRITPYLGPADATIYGGPFKNFFFKVGETILYNFLRHTYGYSLITNSLAFYTLHTRAIFT